MHFHAEERADVSACLAWVPWRLVLLAVAEVLFVVTGRPTWYVESINGLVKTEFEQQGPKEYMQSFGCSFSLSLLRA